jgi:hypothetical protein
VELATDPGSAGSIAILRGGGLEAWLEGVSEYGLMLRMVRHDEVEDKNIEYLTAFFSVVDPRRMICVHNLRRLACSTARTCMAGTGQCHRNPL